MGSSADAEEGLGLLGGRNFATECVGQFDGGLDERGVRWGEYATSQVHRILETRTDTRCAVQQRQSEQARMVTTNAGHRPERLWWQRPHHRVERRWRGIDAAGDTEDEIDVQRSGDAPFFQPAHRLDDVADLEAVGCEAAVMGVGYLARLGITL